MSALSLVAAQDQFTATLSAVEDAVRFAFRKRLRPQEYEEALAEARAAAWSAWHGLIKRGKDPVAVGVHGIATNAVRYVRNGRKVGNLARGQAAMDVYHRKAQAKGGFNLVSLDSGDEFHPDRPFGGAWREWLAEDNRATPADEACFHVDFETWLESLPARKRQMAVLLAEGLGTSAVARLLGVTMPAVSIARTWLEASWRAFQGETVRVDVPPVSRPVGRPRKLGHGLRVQEKRDRSVARAVVEVS
jgi:hypothetical protein